MREVADAMPGSDKASRDAGEAESGTPAMTGGKASVWLRFALIVAVLLGGDLLLKYWAFDRVASDSLGPIGLRTAEAGGPEVLLRSPIDGEWVSAYEAGLTGHPSVVPGHEPIVVVPGLLNFQLTLNTGAVFGIGKGGRPFFIVVSLIAVVVVLWFVYRSPPGAWSFQFGLACILGGALGNMYDRVLYSAVRDMLHMLPGTGLWPWIFNLADVVLIVGVSLTMLLSVLADRRAMQARKLAEAQAEAGSK